MKVKLDPKRLARRDDPHTSLAAAKKASKASQRAINAVQALMQDGEGRIDEEIWADCRANGYVASLATVQHGRLALSEACVLVETGRTRKTSNNTASREWILK